MGRDRRQWSDPGERFALPAAGPVCLLAAAGFVNAADLGELGLAHGDLVEVETALPSDEARRISLTAIAHDIARGSVAAYYPETNGLVPLDYQDKQSGTPSYKSVPVRIRRAA